jgi:hypothetical protein
MLQVLLTMLQMQQSQTVLTTLMFPVTEQAALQHGYPELPTSQMLKTTVISQVL